MKMQSNAEKGTVQPALLGIGAAAALAVSLLVGMSALHAAGGPTPAVGVVIPDNPIFAVAENKPNVLMVLDNSNSMDEAPSGAAVGSNSPDSKSQIARGVIKGILQTYSGQMSVGLMAYKQNTPAAWYLHASPYDASYDPANYNPSFAGDRASATKRYRVPNPTSPGDYVYYNVSLPFYASTNQGNLFCYSTTATFPTGTNGSYACYSAKTGTSDGAPAGNGYSGFIGNYSFSPTDSDYAQGISAFGRRMASFPISQTWYDNNAPGRGYLHVPIQPLDAAQTAALNAKLDCNIPPGTSPPAPCTTAGIKNAGLTPIEGTLLTAKDYFGGTLSDTSEGFTAATYPLPVTCAKNYVILLTDGLPSTDKSGAVVSNPSTAIAAAAAAAAQLKAAGVSTYVIGFALPFGTDPTTLDQIASAGGTTNAYSATDQASLQAALSAIFATINADSGSSGATTTNTTGLSTSSRIYKASFNPADWSGALEGFPVSSNVVTSNTANWTATIPAPASRKIYTWNGSSAVQFTWATMPASQKTALGSSDVLDYLRGDQTKEGTSCGTGCTYRKRSSLLGDIVYSAPAYINEIASGSLPAMEVIAVGSNDGMLHVFDAVSGVEKFAYVPAGVDFAALKTYTTEAYLKSHKYFVDGQISISERADVASGRNILVATLGRGGMGAFALDVTDPNNISVLWDKTGSAAPAGMGYVLGTPFIGRVAGSGNSTADVVFVPNGITRPGAMYSGQDLASLFVLNLSTGSTFYSRIDAIDSTDAAGVSNALSTPRGWDQDDDGLVDYVYAGDIRGNVWKFDVTGSPSVKRMFVASRSGLRQPISGGVTVSLDPSTYTVWTHFGTGEFFNSPDFNNRDVQSIYGVQDTGSNSVLTRADLQARTIQSQATANSRLLRFLEPDGALQSGKVGWYIDLLDPSSGAQGERVTGTPQEVNGQLRVSSGIPGASACKPIGGGFVYIINAFTGASLPYQAIDTNGDGVVDDTDKTGGKVTGGIGLTVGLVGDTLQNGDMLTAGGSENKLTSFKIRDDAARGRVAWREVVRD